MTTATHQQKGQHCGNANGSQGTQKPAAVGTTVRSTCQTWLGRSAVTRRKNDVVEWGWTDRQFAAHAAHTANGQVQAGASQNVCDLDLAQLRAESLQAPNGSTH